MDTLIVGAVVEARSCERFRGLAARLGGRLGRFYGRLLESEARHASVYLDLARSYAGATGDAASFDCALGTFWDATESSSGAGRSAQIS